MTEDLIRRLIAAGLSKQQASSITAETLVNLFMPDDGKMLIREAKGQVAEIRQLVNDLKKQYTDLKRKVEGIRPDKPRMFHASTSGKASPSKPCSMIRFPSSSNCMDHRDLEGRFFGGHIYLNPV